MSSQRPDLSSLRRTARLTGLRLRLDEALGQGARWLVVLMVYVVVALSIIKVLRPPAELERALVFGAVLPALVFAIVVLRALLRRRPWFAGALVLDRHHGLSDRVTNALAFERQTDRTPLMEVAIEDAKTVADKLSARRAAPIRFPVDLLVAGVLGLAVYGISLLEVRTTRFVPEPKSTFEPLVVSQDDLEVFRAMGQDIEATEDPELQTAVRRFNQLVEDLAEKRLDQKEVFRRLEEIESGLLGATDAEAEAVDAALKEIGEALSEAKASEETGAALEAGDLPDAAQAMEKLAERLENKEKIDKKRLEELRKALEKASRKTTERSQALESERSSLEQRRKQLLKKKEEEGLSKQEQRELDKTERRLERLDRQKKRDDKAKRELDELDRDLAKAARDLMKELGDAAKDLQSGAENLNRSAQKKMTRKQKQELKKRLEQMRELLRQQGQGGKKRLQQLMRFGQRARGGRPGEGQPGGNQGKNGKQGQGQGQGQGKGKGKGQPVLTLKPGQPGDGPTALMPGGELPMPGGGDQPGDPGGSGSAGQEWGSGHDPNLKGDETSLDGELEDVSAAAADTGQGASASETIYGAAERGFVGKGYEQVFVDYETVAEEVLSRDEIPPGYEFYVRRYFQLIRPRE